MAIPVKGDAITPSWASAPALSSTTNDATVVQNSSTSVIIAGGLAGTSPSYTITNTVSCYNLTTGESKALAPLPAALYGAAGAADDDGNVYVISGRDSADALSAGLYIYGSGTGSWSNGQAIPTPVAGAKAACIDSKVYVIGGMAQSGACKLLQIYHIDTDTWTAGPDMAEARFRGALAVDSAEEQIYYIGGSNGAQPAQSVNTVLRYSVGGDYWGVMDDAPFSMTAGAAVSGPDGLIYVFGGSANHIQPTTPYPTSWCFNPAHDTWTAGPDLLKAVIYQGTARSNTSVFVIGGSDGNNGTAQVQKMKVMEHRVMVSNSNPGPGEEITIYFDIDCAFGTVDRAMIVPLLETPDGYSATLSAYGLGYAMAIDTDRFFVTITMPESLVLGEYKIGFYAAGIVIGDNEVSLDINKIPLTVTSTKTMHDQVNDLNNEATKLQASVDSKADSLLTYLVVALLVVAVVMLALMMFRKRA